MVTLSKKMDCKGQSEQVNTHYECEVKDVRNKSMELLIPIRIHATSSCSCNNFNSSSDCSWNCWQIE